VIGIGKLSFVCGEREREREMKTWKSKRKWKTRKKRDTFILGGGFEKSFFGKFPSFAHSSFC